MAEYLELNEVDTAGNIFDNESLILSLLSWILLFLQSNWMLFSSTSFLTF